MTVSAETWLPLGPLEDMEEGERREVTLPTGKIILLIKAEGKIHAVCADCPHQDTPLAEGSVEGAILTCPLHFWQWDIRTGEEVGLAELPLEILNFVTTTASGSFAHNNAARDQRAGNRGRRGAWIGWP